DRNTDAAGFLAARGSTAKWIAARRLAELGRERALACLELQAATPATYIRPAPGRLDAVKEKLVNAGIAAEPGPHDALLRVAPRVKATELFELCGAEILAPEQGWRVLDLCAAPGGKATHLAQLGAQVTAWDIDPDRLALVAENAERLGLANLVCAEPEGEYDAVLVDAPCSNTGVLARRPEARWRVKERHLKNLIERQRKILRTGAGHVKPGGVLVYSTCSLETDENRGVADFLVEHEPFTLESDKTCYPDESGGDGGYMARLVRSATGAG
ncbi:MAG: RsmB/NOP family class I SAM-dependent RNA methyltransferase, partial [Planctomycetota bacterium]